MATQVQWRGGSTAEHATFTGAAREVTVDTQKKTLVVHDGSTAGGEPLLREDQANLPSSVTNGIYSPSANNVAISTNGTGRLFVDASGNVGVATASPGAALDVAGNIRAISAAPIIYINNTSSQYAIKNSSDSFTIEKDGNERLRITSDGKVGLGTSSPQATCHVNGAILSSSALVALSASNIFFDQPTSALSRIGVVGANTSTAGTLSISQYSSNGSVGRDAVHIDSSGRVGIGVNAPDPGGQGLHVHNASAADSSVRITNSTTGATNGDGFAIQVASDGTARLRQFENVALTFETNATERGRWDSSGRFLVGTSSARTIATQSSVIQNEGTSFGTTGFSTCRNSNDIYGPYIHFGKTRGASVGSNTIVASGDDLGGLIFGGADGTDVDSQAAYIICQVDGTPGANDMPGRLVFSTTADGASSPTERMRITSAGGVKFNTTSDTIDSSNFGTTIGSNSVGNFDPGLFRTSRNQSGVQVVIQAYGNAGQFRTMGDGDAENTNNSYGGLSDAKLKENIVDANSQWNDLKALQIRNYNFKAETGYNTHTQIGLIAQEVELISPGLVGESIDEETGESTKSVNYSVLYMKAVKALQEAMERIETLEADVAALKAS